MGVWCSLPTCLPLMAHFFQVSSICSSLYLAMRGSVPTSCCSLFEALDVEACWRCFVRASKTRLAQLQPGWNGSRGMAKSAFTRLDIIFGIACTAQQTTANQAIFATKVQRYKCTGNDIVVMVVVVNFTSACPNLLPVGSLALVEHLECLGRPYPAQIHGNITGECPRISHTPRCLAKCTYSKRPLHFKIPWAHPFYTHSHTVGST